MYSDQLTLLAHLVYDIDDCSNKLKDKCRVDWENSKSMPRKLKKQERKSILLNWSIANWNPLDEY